MDNSCMLYVSYAPLHTIRGRSFGKPLWISWTRRWGWKDKCDWFLRRAGYLDINGYYSIIWRYTHTYNMHRYIQTSIPYMGPGPGNRGNYGPEPGESWKSWPGAQEIVEIVTQSPIPEQCVSPNSPISLYITHTHTRIHWIAIPTQGAGDIAM